MQQKEPDRLNARRAADGASGSGGARESAFEMISVPAALALVLSHTPAASSTTPATVSLSDAFDRILAVDVTATEPFPPFRASVMDGYAVVSSDGAGIYPVMRDITAGVDLSASSATATATATASTSASASASGGAKSGSSSGAYRLHAGSVAYITTGAPVPDGADAVVMVEKTQLVPNEPNKVKIMDTASVDQFIRPIGCDIKLGETTLKAGDRLGAAEIGILASLGVTQVRVIPRPRVAILSTGDELVDASVRPTGAQIRDSNKAMLMAAVVQAGGVPIDLGIVSDKVNELESRVVNGLNSCDLLVLSGGVSMGTLDLVKPLLQRIGTVHFGRLSMKPGKPTTFATVTVASSKVPKLVFALPGNPVSALVSFHLLAEPAMLKLAGHPPPYTQPEISVRLAHDFVCDPTRTEYHRVTLHWDNSTHSFVAVSTGPQHSSRLLSARSANGFVIVPPATAIATDSKNTSAVCARGSILPALIIGRLTAAPYTPAAASTAAFPSTAAIHSHVISTGGAGGSGSSRSGGGPPAVYGGGGAGGSGSHHSGGGGCPHHHPSATPNVVSSSGATPSAATTAAAAAVGKSGEAPTGLPLSGAGASGGAAATLHPHPTAPAAGGAAPSGGTAVAASTAAADEFSIRIGVLTCSDRCHRGMTEDKSGPAAVSTFQTWNESVSGRAKSKVFFSVTERAVVPDETKVIRDRLLQWCEPLPSAAAAAAAGEPVCHLIVTTGGTGFTARDVTPEATRAVIEKEAPGVVTAMLHAVLNSIPSAMLSRAVCGIRNRTLIVNLPGSPKAVVEYLHVLFPTLSHGIKLIQNVNDLH